MTSSISWLQTSQIIQPGNILSPDELKMEIGNIVISGLDQRDTLENMLRTVKGIAQNNPLAAKQLGLEPIDDSGIKNFLLHQAKSILKNAEGQCGSSGEKWKAVFDIGFFDALKVKETKEAALQDTQILGESEKLAPQGVWFGELDAFRHCDWMCRTSHAIGSEQAAVIGKNHEACGPKTFQEDTQMDLGNNATSASFGKNVENPENCATLCEEAVENNQLRVIQSYGIKIFP